MVAVIKGDQSSPWSVARASSVANRVNRSEDKNPLTCPEPPCQDDGLWRRSLGATLIDPAPVIVISDMQQTYLGSELAEHKIGTGRICHHFPKFVGQSHALSKRFRVITARPRQTYKERSPAEAEFSITPDSGLQWRRVRTRDEPRPKDYFHKP